MKFTLHQQAAHCDQLAALLRNLPAEKYDHSTYSQNSPSCGTVACALGWAAHAHIGGLEIKTTRNHIQYPSMTCIAKHDSLDHPEKVGDMVFGAGAYNRIFSLSRNYIHPELEGRWHACGSDSRQLSIELLEEQAIALRSIDKVLTTVEAVIDDVPEAVVV